MSAELKIAMGAFNRAAAICVLNTERTYPEFLNGQGLRLASFAARETEKASASKIAWELGQSDIRRINKRTGGQLKTPRRVFSSGKSLSLYRIVNWRRKRVGLEPLGGKEMSGPARKMRGASLRSTGFIAAGWLWAIRGLARAVGYAKSDYSLPKISGKPKGFVILAQPAISSKVECTIGNTSLLAQSADRTGRRDGRPMAIAAKGLTRAGYLTAKDMMAHLERKLAPIFKQHSAA